MCKQLCHWTVYCLQVSRFACLNISSIIFRSARIPRQFLIAQSHIADDDVPNLHFQGFARVNLTALEFSSAPSARSAEHRPISDKGVDRLLRIFRTEGCKREDENHFITGWVRNEQLEGVASGRDGCLRTVPPVAWEDVPCLDVRPIQYLNSLHRIHAAKKYLNGGDR